MPCVADHVLPQRHGLRSPPLGRYGRGSGCSAPMPHGSCGDIVGIGDGERRAEEGDLLAVGLDQGHIDAVDRGHLIRPRVRGKVSEDWRSVRFRAGRVTPAALQANREGQRDRRPSRRTSCGSCTSAAWCISAAIRAPRRAAVAGTRTAYIGFDCTADSLHVGSLMQIMMLRWWQKTGHQPIVLMGGGTTKVGDPSAEDEAAQLLTDEQIAANIASIRTVFDRFLTFGDGPTDAVMVDNAEWLDKLRYVPFLRDVGRHFSINRMLTMDSVQAAARARPAASTFLEFNYMILQAYDFVELDKRYGCILQMGGSDQWGNIIIGVDLGRRIDGRRAVRPDHAADHDRRPARRWASGGGRGVAERRAHVALRLLAILAQHRGRGCRPLPASVHRSAARRDCAPGKTEGRGDQRGEEDSRHRRTRLPWAPARSRPRPTRRTFEEGGKAENLPTVDVPRARLAAGIAAFELFHEAGLAESRTEARS